MKVCPSCSNENPDDSVFCGFCGYKVKADAPRKTLFAFGAVTRDDAAAAAQRQETAPAPTLAESETFHDLTGAAAAALADRRAPRAEELDAGWDAAAELAEATAAPAVSLADAAAKARAAGLAEKPRRPTTEKKPRTQPAASAPTPAPEPSTEDADSGWEAELNRPTQALLEPVLKAQQSGATAAVDATTSLEDADAGWEAELGRPSVALMEPVLKARAEAAAAAARAATDAAAEASADAEDAALAGEARLKSGAHHKMNTGEPSIVAEDGQPVPPRDTRLLPQSPTGDQPAARSAGRKHVEAAAVSRRAVESAAASPDATSRADTEVEPTTHEKRGSRTMTVIAIIVLGLIIGAVAFLVTQGYL